MIPTHVIFHFTVPGPSTQSRLGPAFPQTLSSKLRCCVRTGNSFLTSSSRSQLSSMGFWCSVHFGGHSGTYLLPFYCFFALWIKCFNFWVLVCGTFLVGTKLAFKQRIHSLKNKNKQTNRKPQLFWAKLFQMPLEMNTSCSDPISFTEKGPLSRRQADTAGSKGEALWKHFEAITLCKCKLFPLIINTE